MNVEDIKSKYTMPDILARYNIRVTKGFCKCSFHDGDNTPSMKVYKDGFYCFGCGAGGDIIKFVQLHDNLKFDEACKWISGEQLTRRSRTQLAIARIERQEKEKAIKRKKQELQRVNKELSGLWQRQLAARDLIKESEEYPDEWCNTFNKWERLCYQQEQLFKELGAI